MRIPRPITPLFGIALAAATAGCPTAAPPIEEPVQPTEPPSDEPKTTSLAHPDEAHLTDIVQLTNGGENAEAYWSFDGTQLIFQTKRPPYQCDQIMRMPADGSAEPTLVSTGKGRTTCSYFMPGDQEIVYSSTHDRGGPGCLAEPDRSKGYVWGLYAEYDVYKANADGSNLRKLTDRPGYDAEATVCAKDGRIIFTSDRDGDLELYVMDKDGQNVTRLTHTPGYDGGAFFSQDCSQIVWRASRPKGAELDEFKALLAQHLVRPSKLEIFVADADGKNARQLTYLDAASFAPYFHPSQKRVLFSTNHGDPRGREFDIWAVDTDGSNLEQITFSEGFDGFPMFSPDGKKLAFASNRNNREPGETNVFVATWVDSPSGAKSAQPGAVERYRDRVAWLADDAREGRGIGTRGLAEAADWLARELAAVGALGAADEQGGYKQTFEVPVALGRGATTALAIDKKPLAEADFVPASNSSSASVSARTVFAGYGIVSKELGVDDYKGVNAKGKIVVVRRFTPSQKPFDTEETRRRYSDIEYKAFEARRHGAVGLVVVDAPAPGEKDVPDAELPELAPRGKPAGIPIAFVTRAAGARLIKGKHQVALSVALDIQTTPVHNVVAKIPAEPGKRLPGVIIVGAHYDHLGYGGDGSLEGKEKVIHNGADDNASGTAALLAVAETLVQERGSLRRDVYLVAFTAEESGFLGSQHFVKHLPPGLSGQEIVAMLNMDMVGRMRDNQVMVSGAATAAEWADIVQPLCAAARLSCSMGGDGYGASDQTSFYSADIPVLHFFTGAHEDYHKGSDDSHRINAAGGVRIAGVVAAAARAAANRDTRLTFQKAVMPPPRGDTRARGGSLGTIPAYGDTGDQPGMLLGDVRPGGPAALAGLRGGDRIIRIDDSEVRTVRDLMYILREAVPGQKARITVVRDGKQVTVTAEYGKPTRRN